MIMHVDSDAAYLVAPGAKSRIAGYYYLSDHPKKSTFPQLNPPFHVVCKFIKHVVASAAEAKTAGLFFNAHNIVSLRRILIALGHPQPPTPLQTDNSTTSDFANRTMKLKRSKSWDMRFHWLRDAENKKDLDVFWGKGSGNLADYYSKHFPPSYHTDMRDSLFIPQNGTTVERSPALRPRTSLPTRTNSLSRTTSSRSPPLPLRTNNSLRTFMPRTSLVSRIIRNVLSSTTLRGCVLTHARTSL